MYRQSKSLKSTFDKYGLHNVGQVFRNLPTAQLYEEVVKRHEGVCAHLGPLVVRTGDHTGRSPNDKFTVKEKTSKDKIWWGKVNVPFEQKKFDSISLRLQAYIQGKDLYVQDCYGGADEKYRIKVRVITEFAWHSLFIRNMLIHIHDPKTLEGFVPDFTIIDVPRFHAIPEIDGTASEAFILVNFGQKLVLIGGTMYAGEMKKSVFTILNYLLPQEKILSMHCSANIGPSDDVAIFFGLSGTGKTTLSADPERRLIGDDEHGWSSKGVFNFEGGCYAKVIKLSPEAEPEIYQCTRRFGTILENVAIDMDSRRVDLDDAGLTENTRAAYPITHLENSIRSGMGGHPKNIIMLTLDAFGVLPPISRMTPEQAMYYFLTGYTAKIAGTEAGVGKEPQATFSPCFGAPFMALPPPVYAKLLGEKIAKHKVNCWLVNTGWIGGPYGVGNRIKIAYTRALINAALGGALDKVSYEEDPIFKLQVPTSCKGVPKDVLNPRKCWKDKKAYDAKAKALAKDFQKNFKPFEKDVSAAVRKAAPKVKWVHQKTSRYL